MIQTQEAGSNPLPLTTEPAAGASGIERVMAGFLAGGGGGQAGVIGAAVLLLLPYQKGVLSALFIFVSLGEGLSNLVPFTTAVVVSDGARISMLLRNGPAAARLMALFKLSGALKKGALPETLAASDLADAVALSDDSPDTIVAHALAWSAAYYRRDDDEAARLRFNNEAKLASEIPHPNIVSVVDYGEDPELGVFMVMEIVNGDTLVGPERTTLALTTIASFVAGLKAQPGVAAPAVVAVLAHHGMGPIASEWGDGDARLRAMYTNLPSPSATPLQVTATLNGGYRFNERPQNQYYVFTATGTQATVTSSSSLDVDLYAVHRGTFLAAAQSASGCELISFATVPGEVYVVVLTGWGGISSGDPGVGNYPVAVSFTSP